MSVVIETTKGDITVDLYVKERPNCCKNFLKLCKIKYYNFCLFHHVQHGFIAQTGDPTGTGRGGESISGVLYGEQARLMKAETIPRIKHAKLGTLSLVNYGEQLLGSQFFITLAEGLDYLDDEHCPIGEVVEGFEVLEKINEAICDDENKPYQDIRITHAVILDDPFEDPPGLEVPDASPVPTKEILDSGRIGADEDINDMQGKTTQEIEEIIQEREAKARATILEMVGDLPDADIAPPENVLFVCKLNPVTTDEDLEIIFSRFGKVKSCEVIRDQKTQESLQYAFIEFEDVKACEEAYFKMDNVLIDDRRIHVDFSQSVAKYKWKGKGRGVQINEGPEKKAPERMQAPWIIQNKNLDARYFNTSKSTDSAKKKRKSRSRSRSRSRSPHRSKHKKREDDRRRRSRSRSPKDSRYSRHYSKISDDNRRKNWSRSPPRYSRGHASEQSKDRRRHKEKRHR